jgi:lysozyme
MGQKWPMNKYAPQIIARAMAQATGISIMFEGLRLNAYPDPGTGAEPWTIGYGSTRMNGRAVMSGDVITNAQAVEMLQADLTESMQIVIANVGEPLSGDELGALTSFVNNIGPGEPGRRDGFVWLANGGHSTMFTYIDRGDFDLAAEQFPLWDRAGGRVMAGLTRRRDVERRVFLGQLDMTGGDHAA